MLEAMMPERPSAAAKSLTDAKRNIRVAIRRFMTLEITFDELTRIINQNIQTVPQQYRKQLKIFAKIELRNYIYFTLNVSFAFFLNYFNKHRKQKLNQNPAFSRFFTTGDADAEVLSKAYQERLKKATIQILNQHSDTRFIADAEANSLYERQMEEVEQLRRTGHKLVVCSSHADCSDLCLPYQGRVYSLDGTTGRTADGRSYSPLEEAIGPTKLFHRFCKHRIVAYHNGEMPPHLTREERNAEVAITTEQRTLERRCRYYYERYIRWIDIDSRKQQHYKEQYTAAVNYYHEFCRRNSRKPMDYRLK